MHGLRAEPIYKQGVPTILQVRRLNPPPPPTARPSWCPGCSCFTTAVMLPRKVNLALFDGYYTCSTTMCNNAILYICQCPLSFVQPPFYFASPFHKYQSKIAQSQHFTIIHLPYPLTQSDTLNTSHNISPSFISLPTDLIRYSKHLTHHGSRAFNADLRAREPIEGGS